MGLKLGLADITKAYLGSTQLTALILGSGQNLLIPPVPAAPANVSAPVISGSAIEGSTLSASNGSWSGYPTPTFAYQWKRGVTNVGTNSPTYTLVSADVGSTLTVTVTATNTSGSASATSAATGTVAAAPSGGAPEIVAAFYGQSNAKNHMGTPGIPSTPAALAGTYVLDPTLNQWVDAASAPAGFGGAALRALLNELRTLTGKTVGLVGHYQDGTSASGLKPGNPVWTEMARRVTASGGRLDVVCYHQGENDAAGVAATGAAAYRADVQAIHQGFADACGKTRATLPFILSGLGSITGAGTSDTVDFQQQTLVSCEQLTNVYYSHSNYDNPINPGDHLHFDGQGLALSGRRYARDAGYALGYIATSNAFRIDRTSCTIQSATVTRVKVIHGGGTDFTPTSGITGFEVSADANTWVTATGARVDSTTIDLTHSTLATGTRYMRYQAGWTPDITGEVIDNSTLNGNALGIPLRMTGGSSGNAFGPVQIAAAAQPAFNYLGRTTNTVDTTADTSTFVLTGTTPAANRRLYFIGIYGTTISHKAATLNGQAARTVFVDGPAATGFGHDQPATIITAVNTTDANLSLVLEHASGDEFGAGAPMFVFAIDDTTLPTARPTDVRRIAGPDGTAIATDLNVNDLGAIIAFAYNSAGNPNYSTNVVETSGTFDASIVGNNTNMNPPNRRTLIVKKEGITPANPASPVSVAWTGGTPVDRADLFAASFGGATGHHAVYPLLLRRDSCVAAAFAGSTFTTDRHWLQGDTAIDRLLILTLTSIADLTSVTLRNTGNSDIALGKVISAPKGGASACASIWSCVVPAGRTGEIFLDVVGPLFGTNYFSYSIMLVPMPDLASATPLSVQSATTPDLTAASVTLQTVKNGFTVAIGEQHGASAAPAWGGDIQPRSAITAWDVFISGQGVGTIRRAFYRTDLLTNAAQTVIFTPGASSTGCSLVAATWAPKP